MNWFKELQSYCGILFNGGVTYGRNSWVCLVMNYDESTQLVYAWFACLMA